MDCIAMSSLTFGSFPAIWSISSVQLWSLYIEVDCRSRRTNIHTLVCVSTYCFLAFLRNRFYVSVESGDEES